MTRLFYSVLIAAYISSAPAAEFDLREYWRTKDEQFVASLKPKDLANVPKWKEENEHPPLSARKAMSAAQAYVDELLREEFLDGQWKFDSLRLRRTVNEDWLYVADFHRVREGFGVTLPFRVMVLMNGQVVRYLRE